MRTIQSVDRACEILEIVRETREVSLSEIADKMDLSMGALHTYLATLCDNGILVKEGRQYRLAPQLITYGEHVRNTLPLYRVGRTVVDEAVHETNESVHLITEHNGLEVSVYQSFGVEAVGSELYIKNQERQEWYLHWSSAGKAILAHMPEDRVLEIINEYGLKSRTPHTITERDALLDNLSEIRERGYAFNDEEEITGLRSVGAPIKDQQGDILGAISISAPKSRFGDERFYDEIPEFITHKANVIEVTLQAEDFGGENNA